MKFCQNCGAQLEDAAAFCRECGSKVTVIDADQETAYQVPPVYQEPAQAQYQAPPVYQESAPVQYQEQPVYQQSAGVPYQAPPVYQQPVTDEQSGLKTAAKVFMVLGCISIGFLTLVGLAWSIPMTVTVFHKFRDNKPVGVGLKVCTLLFVNLIAGILLLCVKNPAPQQQQYYY